MAEVLLLPQTGEVLAADDGAKILLICHRLLGHKNILVPTLQIDQCPLGLVVLNLETRRLMIVLLLDVQVLEIEDGSIIVYDRRDRCLLRLQSLLLRHQTELHLLLLRHYYLLLLSQFLELCYLRLLLLILNKFEKVLSQIGNLQILLRQFLLDVLGRRGLTYWLQADHRLLLWRWSSLAAEYTENVSLLRFHHLQALLLSGLHQLGNKA